MSGKIPDAMALRDIQEMSINTNRLSGKIPDAIASMSFLGCLDMCTNHLGGKIPDVITSMTWLTDLHMCTNQLSGKIPDGIRSMMSLNGIYLQNNKLSGSIPIAVTSLTNLLSLCVHSNKLSGPLPYDSMVEQRFLEDILISDNRLTGSLQTLQTMRVQMASRNLLEGALPNVLSSDLRVLDLSGAAGHIGDLKGPLPPALCRASQLGLLAAANNQMEGVIPSFSSTLWLLALHKNRFKVFPNVHLEKNAPILLQNNLLSCAVPRCGNATATSVVAIGNKLRYPKDGFPTWVSKFEQDSLLWVSGKEGLDLTSRISGAASLFVVVVAARIGRARLLMAMSRWQAGPATHLWVVKASAHVVSSMLKESVWQVLFLIVLLSWDVFACPQTLALASACARSSTLIWIFVLSCCYRVCLHSTAVGFLAMHGANHRQKQATEIPRKRLLLWSLWCVLTVALSAPAILYQVIKSIPGFLPAWKILKLSLATCIGAIQALVSKFAMPYLAEKVAWNKHPFMTVSTLIMNCVIPAVIIMYLDTECLGQWVTFWKPCRSDTRPFEHRLMCNSESNRDCDQTGLRFEMEISISILRERDICDPRYSGFGGRTSMSRCIETSPLRLQEIWLAKFITTGLVIPGMSLARNNLPTQSGAVVSNILSGPISRDTAIVPLQYPISWDTFHGKLTLPQNSAIPPQFQTGTSFAIPHFATYGVQ